MGIFKAIGKGLKAIGKGFKSIGKGIMKGFRAVGKFINKLGIFGQIGMALIMPGIMNAAFGALSSMGSGFMASLAQKGWTAAGALAPGAGAGLARVSHAVLQGAVTAGSKLSGTLSKLTDTVVGTATDSLRMVGNKVTGTFLESSSKFYINPVTALEGTKGAASQFVTGEAAKTTWTAQLNQLGENTAKRLSNSWGEFASGVSDIKEIAGFGEGGPHVPKYETYTMEQDKVLGLSRDPKLVTKDINLPSNFETYMQSPEYKETVNVFGGKAEQVSDFSSVGSEQGSAKQFTQADVSKQIMPKEPSSLLGGSWDQAKEDFLATYKGKNVLREGAENVATRAAMDAMRPKPAYDPLVAKYGAYDQYGDVKAIAWQAAQTGFGDTFEERFGASLHPDSQAVNNILGLGPNGEYTDDFWAGQDYLKNNFQFGSGMYK